MSDTNPNTACEHGHQRRKCPHCEIVQLEAELAKVSKERDEYKEIADIHCKPQSDEIVRLEKLNEKLKADLKKYGKHDSHRCEIYFKQFLGEKVDCTCGLDAALAEGKEGN